MGFKIDKKIANQRIKIEHLSEDEKFEKELNIAKSIGIGCQVAEKVNNKTIKNKGKIKVAEKGLIISAPPENDKRIPWEKIISAERWTHNSLKINLVKDIPGIESPIIYLTNCYASANLVNYINELSKGEVESGWD